MATTTLQFPFSKAPEPGALQEIVPGVHWLRMPLPFALDHINLWALEDAEGWTLVDSGLNTQATRQSWKEILAGPLKSKPVTRVICTHFHPDHIGLAGWLCEFHKVPLTITDKEWKTAYTILNSQPDHEATARYYERVGMPIGDAGVLPRNVYADRVFPLPADRVRIQADTEITAGGKSWRVVIGEGHSPELATLYSTDSRLLISGDQILPGISPNVSVRPENPNANPLKEFMESIAGFRGLPPETLVLPSHKLPFVGLHERIDDLLDHHRGRLDVARKACKGVTAMEVLAAVFPRALDAHQIHFAVGETLAHLNYLIADGQVLRVERNQGPDLYRAIP